MKRKIITKKQLDRLVSLGVVVLKLSGYHCVIDGGELLKGPMFEDLLGCSVVITKNNKNKVYPFKAKNNYTWNIPAFILACNYEEMLAKVEDVRK